MITVFSILGTLLFLSGILLLLQHARQKRKQVEVAMSQIDEIQKRYDRLSQDSLQKEIDTLSQQASFTLKGAFLVYYPKIPPKSLKN